MWAVSESGARNGPRECTRLLEKVGECGGFSGQSRPAAASRGLATPSGGSWPGAVRFRGRPRLAACVEARRGAAGGPPGQCGCSQAWKALALYEEESAPGSAAAWHPPLVHPGPRTLLNSPKVWVGNFRKRWHVKLRRVTRLSELSDAVVREKICSFWRFCKWLLATGGREATWINFDETPLWFAQYTGRTNLVQEGREAGDPVIVRGKGSLTRKRITVGLTISTDPEFARRVPVFVVCRNPHGRHRPNSAQWRSVVVPGGMVLRFQIRAWMDEELVLDYLRALVAAWDEYRPPPPPPWVDSRPPLVLVWDSFKGHLTDAVKEFCRGANIQMVVVPGGLTGLVQGLDTHVNKAFKALCREFWRRRVLLLEDPCAAALDNQGFLEMIEWAAGAALRETIPSRAKHCAGMNVGAASFLQNGLTNATDGSQDSVIAIKHPAVDAAWRGALPCAPPTAGELAAVVAEADPGYGSDGSDFGEDDAGGGEAEVMQRIIARRDAELDAAESDPEAPPARGSLWTSAQRGPGTRRSSRRIVAARPFSFPDGALAASSGAASGSAPALASARTSSSSLAAVPLPALLPGRGRKRPRVQEADVPPAAESHAARGTGGGAAGVDASPPS